MLHPPGVEQGVEVPPEGVLQVTEAVQSVGRGFDARARIKINEPIEHGEVNPSLAFYRGHRDRQESGVAEACNPAPDAKSGSDKMRVFSERLLVPVLIFCPDVFPSTVMRFCGVDSSSVQVPVTMNWWLRAAIMAMSPGW